MGLLEKGFVCPTDGHSYITCPGYFGHIELARPVLFVQHMKEIKNSKIGYVINVVNYY